MPQRETAAEYANERVECFDFESLLRVVSGGQFEHLLTGGAEFAAELESARVSDLAFDRGFYSSAVSVAGAFDSDRIVLGQVFQQTRPTRINGYSCELGHLQVYGEGCELEFDCGPDVGWNACTIAREELQAAAESLLGRSVELPSRGMAYLRLDSRRYQRLRREIDHFLARLTRLQKRSAEGAPHLRRRLVAAYVRALGGTEMRLPSNSVRRRLAARGRDVVLQTLDRPYCSQDVCAAIACSERSLELAFRERFGMSPRRWHLIARLNLARRRLLSGDPSQTVTEVATSLGFFEIGRFSQYYSRQFAERPSATLAAGSRRRSRTPK